MAPGPYRKLLVVRFALLGACAGLLVGIVEAAILFFTPRVPTLNESELGWVIWLLAPLLDFGLFLLLGIFLGSLASTIPDPKMQINAVLTAVLVGLVGAFLSWSVALAHVWPGDLEAIKEFTVPAEGFGLTFLLTLYALRLAWYKIHHVFNPAKPWPLGGMTKAVATIVAGLSLGLVLKSLGESVPQSAHASGSTSQGRPNIVLIVLDTVRADHLSSYGYSRQTTPHLDRLAQLGVLFENAVAPSPWTLPSHASIFTGLLPHQHGANIFYPLSGHPKTLAEILHASGYETASFFANDYGVAPWGLVQGFEIRGDNREYLPHNLWPTMVGRGVVHPIRINLNPPDFFSRRRAPDINGNVLRWFKRRSDRPFFLFINYFDVHDPYVQPPPYGNRFGKIQPDVVRRVSFGNGLPPHPPLTPAEQASLIVGYDNGLAFLDDQVGKLVESLAQSPEWKNTILIVTSDHGDAFGTHGPYLHGRTLYYREALQVPLIVAGPGTPAGLRVSSMASIRQLFPTILDLAMPDRVPFRASSLRRFWTPGFKVDPMYDYAVSELVPFLPNFRPVMMSLMTGEWHYIRKSDASAELYDWKSDPQEQVDLANSPQHQQILKGLEQRLKELAGESARPWWEPEYLLALNGPDSSFAYEAVQMRSLLPSPGDQHRPIGSSQAFFMADLPSSPQRPAKPDEDLIRSLPYR